MKQRTKRKACASTSSEARIVESPPQQPLDTPRAQLDLSSSTSNTLGSSSINGCRGCRTTARRYKRSLQVQNVAAVDVRVSSIQVQNASTITSNVSVPSAASVNARVPALPVLNPSTTKRDVAVPSAISVKVRVPALSVVKVSATKCHVDSPSASSRKLIISNETAGSAKNKLPSQAPLVVSTVSSSSPSLTDAAAGPKAQGSSNKVAMNVAAQSPSIVSTVSSPTPSLASDAAAGASSQTLSNTLSSSSVANVPMPAQIDDDPYSSMRLDSDNMSYEELIALQDRIGYVSTGLSGKEMVKARKITTYRVKRRKTTKDEEVDTKCSICQEEYATGDKLGNLKCKHRYHLNCIEQWLRQKNWCPTCKNDARACL